MGLCIDLDVDRDCGRRYRGFKALVGCSMLSFVHDYRRNLVRLLCIVFKLELVSITHSRRFDSRACTRHTCPVTLVTLT